VLAGGGRDQWRNARKTFNTRSSMLADRKKRSTPSIFVDAFSDGQRTKSLVARARREQARCATVYGARGE
jgi:hypothetical protein